MEGEPISAVLNYMIELYNSDKQFKSLKHDPLLNVCKFLVGIYGEINVVNPYLSGNISVLATNLTVYGMNIEKIDEFLLNLNEFYQEYIVKKGLQKTELLAKIYFILFDMVLAKSKRENISDAEFHFFETLIYSGNNNNYLMKLYNMFINKDKNAIFAYWSKTKDEIKNPVIMVKEEPKPLLEAAVYANYGLSYEEVSQMSMEEIIKINDQITKQSDNTTTGGRNVEKPKKLVLTSGNAVIDSILFLGFVATQLLMGFILILEFIKR